jgi:hypothetical protein
MLLGAQPINDFREPCFVSQAPVFPKTIGVPPQSVLSASLRDSSDFGC